MRKFERGYLTKIRGILIDFNLITAWLKQIISDLEKWIKIYLSYQITPFSISIPFLMEYLRLFRSFVITQCVYHSIHVINSAGFILFFKTQVQQPANNHALLGSIITEPKIKNPQEIRGNENEANNLSAKRLVDQQARAGEWEL